ncbi:MAG: hypothetical protein IJ806_04070 [Ruminococcus sp.]|nr:hypothetical protein [Ruminococcus sp.]
MFGAKTSRDLKDTEPDFLKKKKEVGGMVGLRELYHISGLSAPAEERCDLILSVNSIYIGFGGRWEQLSLSFADEMLVMDRSELEEALKRDPGSQFYNYLAYGPPGLLAYGGIEPPGIVKKLGHCYMLIKKGSVYTSDFAGMQAEARQTFANTGRSFADTGTYREMKQREYEGRDKRYDYICLRVGRGSGYIAKNIKKKFDELKNNRRDTFVPQRNR